MVDQLSCGVAVVADNATQPPVSPRTPSLPTQTTHPSVSRRSSLQHPSAHANETRWVSRAPKWTVFKRKTSTMPCRAPQPSRQFVDGTYPLYPWTKASRVEQLECSAAAKSSSAEASRSASPRPIRVRSIQRTGPTRIRLGTISVGSRVRQRPPLPSAPRCRACKGPVKYLPEVDGGAKRN